MTENLFNMAVLYQKQKKNKEALSLYRKLLQIDPKDKVVLIQKQTLEKNQDQ